MEALAWGEGRPFRAASGEREIPTVVTGKGTKQKTKLKIEKLIEIFTDENDVVFDPFAGSNVVGRITCLLNRKSLSTELSKLYHSIGCKMLENALVDYNENDYRTLKKLLCPKQNDNSMAA